MITSSDKFPVATAQGRSCERGRWLANRPFIATEDFTVADILMPHVLDAGTQEAMLTPYPNLLAYRARCTQRPAWQKTLDAYRARVEAA